MTSYNWMVASLASANRDEGVFDDLRQGFDEFFTQDLEHIRHPVFTRDGKPPP